MEKLFQIQWVGIEKRKSPFLSYDDDGQEISVKFNDLPLRTKADIVHCLCDYRLFADDICQRITDINAEDFRIEPLGTDSKGYIYWYFYGTRLYRENPSVAETIEQKYKKQEELAEKKAKDKVKEKQELEKRLKEEEKKKKRNSLPPKALGFRTGLRQRKSETSSDSLPNGVCSSKSKNNSINNCSNKTIDVKDVFVSLDERREAWSLVCNTEQDWNDLTLKFSKSKHKSELDLYKLLSKNFVPRISEIYEEREKERQRIERQKLIELLPRRASSRIELKKIQREKEEIEEQETLRKQKDEETQQSQESERQRSERIKKEREIRAQKRLLAVEERAERALKRDRFEMNGEDSFGSNMETNSQFDYIAEE